MSHDVWWRNGYVWMVLAGPAMVVVAGIATAVIAIRGSDPVVDQNYYQSGLRINQTLAAQPTGMTPAMQARNHAQTPAEP